jgi:hypothetical protein
MSGTAVKHKGKAASVYGRKVTFKLQNDTRTIAGNIKLIFGFVIIIIIIACLCYYCAH